MGKPAGSPKTGGRTPGTPNKRTIAFSETLEARGVNLLETILDEIEKLRGAEKVKALTALLPYQFPKRRPSTTPELMRAEFMDELSFTELLEVRNASNQAIEEETAEATRLSGEELLEKKDAIERILERRRQYNEIFKDPLGAK